jgi:hypothetical protein
MADEIHQVTDPEAGLKYSKGDNADTKDSQDSAHDEEDETKASLMQAQKVRAEKVIVLSFRGLQLKRIAELQDRLLELSVQATNITPTKPLSKNQGSMIDSALKEYGEQT